MWMVHALARAAWDYRPNANVYVAAANLPCILEFLTGAMFASFVVSFVSVGWWSELGDRRGRRIVLFCSILGALLMCAAAVIFNSQGR